MCHYTWFLLYFWGRASLTEPGAKQLSKADQSTLQFCLHCAGITSFVLPLSALTRVLKVELWSSGFCGRLFIPIALSPQLLWLDFVQPRKWQTHGNYLREELAPDVPHKVPHLQAVEERSLFHFSPFSKCLWSQNSGEQWGFLAWVNHQLGCRPRCLVLPPPLSSVTFSGTHLLSWRQLVQDTSSISRRRILTSEFCPETSWSASPCHHVLYEGLTGASKTSWRSVWPCLWLSG